MYVKYYSYFFFFYIVKQNFFFIENIKYIALTILHDIYNIKD